ncbi:MAG TPA: redoxin domain-containing protein [Candidatus Acidoferrales bacterium]|nr:redoxin domain-containing protein [Candidatus Acidoferrales bacterium]
MTKLRAILVAMTMLGAIACPAARAQKLERAPNFTGGTWIDTGEAGSKVPHSIKGYRGQVLLVDFWEYTCINCIRDFSVLKRWYAKYHPYGFEIVGVHFGEFPMGYDANNVRDAAKRFRLPWPIVADLQGTIWNAYHSDVWPNRYLIDQNGDIVLHIEGEGNNAPLEQKIRALLEPAHPEMAKIPTDPPENAFAASCGVPTDETYVGHWFGRGSLENKQGYDDGSLTDFRATGEPKDGGVMLSGKWITAQDGVTSRGNDARAELRYHARSVYAVLSAGNPKKPVKVYVLQDGKPLSKNEAGVDVRFDAQGSYIEVSDPRMYYLLKNLAFGSHLLVLAPQAGGFSLHSFTYGNNCQQDFQPL